ncbi:MAG: 3',5'-cyclic-AMP phosphodiesterase [Gammaproteobacteria bacterium]
MSADSTPVRLLQITDTHLFAEPGKTLYGVNTRESLRRVLDAAMRHPKPDLVLATGDLVHDESPAGYNALSDMLRVLAAPVAAIAGNHDALIPLRSITNSHTHVGGVHTLGAWQIVLLNTLTSGKVGGHLDEAELEFLESALAHSHEFNILIALHHQPVPIGSAWLDRIALDNAGEFFDVVDRFKNVRAVLWGHIHQTFESKRQGVRLMATPSTCVQFLPGSKDFAVDTKPPGMRWLMLYTNGQIDTEIELLQNM